MKVERFEAGDFLQNTYLVRCENTGEAVAVDPGAGTGALLGTARRRRFELEAVVLTHAHLDHVEGVARVRDHYPEIPIHLHRLDRPLYDNAANQARQFGMQVRTPPPPTRELRPGETLRVGSSFLEIRFAPGHSPGHVILVHAPKGARRADGGAWEGSVRPFALVGDVVFSGSIGRTDLPGGDFRTLLGSIESQVLTLPDDAVLYPGHGPSTTVGAERAHNPFLQGPVVPNYR